MNAAHGRKLRTAKRLVCLDLRTTELRRWFHARPPPAWPRSASPSWCRACWPGCGPSQTPRETSSLGAPGPERQVRRRKQGQVQVCVLTWMAPRFSVSCSGLDVPRRTELTPSFLKHQAGGRHRLQFTHCPPDGATRLILLRKLQRRMKKKADLLTER